MNGVRAAYVASFAVHAALFGGLVAMRPPREHHSLAVTVVMHSAPPAPKPMPTPAKAPEAKTAAPRAANPRPAPRPHATTPKPVAAPHAAAPQGLSALPNLGISMSGSTAGGGVAVGAGSGAGSGAGAGPATTTSEHQKTLSPSHAAADACDEPLVKAKVRSFSQPRYTDDARAAGVEGRVRLRLRIDASGNVTSVSVLSGLGHGLDQAAAAAARQMKFSPATRCGKPVPSSFVIALRFELGG
jgi:periplasmic protein TonB